MSYIETLNKNGANILITGDSIAYNRYGYDLEARENAYNCGVGMPSWSFALRDRIYKSDKQFILGADIRFSCETVAGIDNESAVPHTAMFAGKIQTLLPNESVTFSVPIQGNQIVLYLQKRLDAPCVFDIEIDGETVITDVSTEGKTDEFAGYGLLVLCLPCNASRKTHTIEFLHIRGESPKITVAGVGAVYKNIVLNGKGGECVSYFIEHFEQRIGQYAPDLLILTLGANDRAQIAPDRLRRDLVQLFSLIGDRFPSCKVLFLLPPSSHCEDDPDRDAVPYTSLLTAEVYNRTIEQVCARFGKEADYGMENKLLYAIETMRIADLFDDAAVSVWRYDNVHLNPYGNERLLQAVSERLGIV